MHSTCILQKNKSAKVKAQVAQIQSQAAMSGKSRETVEKEKEKALRAKAKLEEEKRAKEEAALLKPVQTQKVPFGVDPKTVLCAFYKAGNCEKGTKCKFSHDLNVGRKVEKKNLYEDSREEKLQGLWIFLLFFSTWFLSKFIIIIIQIIDTMDTWDEEKLRTVVLSKAGNPRTTTDVSSLNIMLVLNSPFTPVPQCRSYANISFRRLSHRNSVGSGNVPTGKIANTDTHYRLDLSSSLRRKQQTRQLKQMLSVWKNF